MERREAIEEAVSGLPLMLTVEQAREVLGIGRSLAYSEVRRYLATGGREGPSVLAPSPPHRVPTRVPAPGEEEVAATKLRGVPGPQDRAPVPEQHGVHVAAHRATAPTPGANVIYSLPVWGGAVTQNIEITRRSLRTPRAAAIAGIAFALLLGTALVMLRIAVPANPRNAATWLDDPWRKDSVLLALNLVPFAGLAFLWFIGAVRDRIGAAEDRFFATVFLGTGLLFVGMLFVAAAIAGGLFSAEVQRGAAEISPEVWRFGRHTTYLVVVVYAMRMAGAFTLVTTTIGHRLGILPRWLAVLGGFVGVVLLLTVESFAWVEIFFPIWVLILSVHFLVQPPPRSRRELIRERRPPR